MAPAAELDALHAAIDKLLVAQVDSNVQMAPRWRTILEERLLDPAHRAAVAGRLNVRSADLRLLTMGQHEEIGALLKLIAANGTSQTELREIVAALSKLVADNNTAMNARVTALEAKRQQLAGKNVALPLLAIGTTEITVSWGQNLGDASYQVALIRSANMPAGVTLSVNRTDAAFCIVTVRTTVAVPLGATFDAIAYRA